MKWFPFVLALAACGGATVADGHPAGAAPALAHLEALPDLSGDALPARADAPRTVVMFFASW